MRDYTYSELMAMQEEATRRVHEMQQRARLTTERAQREIKAPVSIEPAPKQIYPKPELSPEPAKPKQIKLPVKTAEDNCDNKQSKSLCKPECPIKNIFGGDNKDKSLILALLLLLGGDDELTMLALLYIMS